MSERAEVRVAAEDGAVVVRAQASPVRYGVATVTVALEPPTGSTIQLARVYQQDAGVDGVLLQMIHQLQQLRMAWGQR